MVTPQLSTTPGRMLEAVGDLMLLFHESALTHRQRHQCAKAESVLVRAIEALKNIHGRMEAGRKRYVIAVVGRSKNGKSTLINALLGQELAPRQNTVCTAVPKVSQCDIGLSRRLGTDPNPLR
jgi:ABC-type Mn2+/Zn2+ transport system ATPase subunit